MKNLHYVFDGRIKKNSIICSDKMKAYIKFAEHEKLQLVQMKGGVSHDGLLHIQHINSYHSGLKTFLRRWRGGVQQNIYKCI